MLKKKWVKIVAIVMIFMFILPVMMIAVLFSSNDNNFEPQTEQEKVAVDIYNYVLSKGGTKEFACAWIGNLENESGLRPDAIQSNRKYDEMVAMDAGIGGYGLGLAQWDRGRRVTLLKTAKESNVEWTETAHQLQYAWEKDGTDSELLQNLSKQTDLDATTVDILIQWERAGTKNDPTEQAKRKSSATNWYRKLVINDLGSSGNIGDGQISVLEGQLGEQVYNGECYGLVSYYVDNFQTGIHLGAGSPQGLQGNIGNTLNAWEIGSAYLWEENGWFVIHNPSYEQIQAGDIINFNQGGIASSSYGHTGIVASVDGDRKYTTYEQNAERGRICSKYGRVWGQDFVSVSSIVRKK